MPTRLWLMLWGPQAGSELARERPEDHNGLVRFFVDCTLTALFPGGCAEEARVTSEQRSTDVAGTAACDGYCITIVAIVDHESETPSATRALECNIESAVADALQSLVPEVDVELIVSQRFVPSSVESPRGGRGRLL